MLLLRMFSRKWLFPTLFVFLGTALCIRLGIWQLDRLDQRRAFNMQVETMRAISPLDLNSEISDSIEKMEWRAVILTGEYDFENQVAIRNQYHRDQYGYHLLAPLLSQGPAVLVDRGWIPADGNTAPSDWRKYDEPGEVKVTGQIRLGQTKPTFGGVADALPADGSPLWVWNNADIASIARQMPYPIGSGASLAPSGISGSADISTALAGTGNLARYPRADIVVMIAPTAAVSSTSTNLVLYRRDINVDGTSDEPIPDASYKAKFAAAQIVKYHDGEYHALRPVHGRGASGRGLRVLFGKRPGREYPRRLDAESYTQVRCGGVNGPATTATTVEFQQSQPALAGMNRRLPRRADVVSTANWDGNYLRQQPDLYHRPLSWLRRAARDYRSWLVKHRKRSR